LPDFAGAAVVVNKIKGTMSVDLSQTAVFVGRNFSPTVMRGGAYSHGAEKQCELMIEREGIRF
jgi:hypothetical protein